MRAAPEARGAPAPSGRRPPCRTERRGAGGARQSTDWRRSDGTSRARRPAKLSEVTRPRATSSASASSSCERSRPLPAAISSKNEAPCWRRKSTTCCARGLGWIDSAFVLRDVQSGTLRTRHQRDRRRAHRRSAALAAIRASAAGTEPRPGHASGKAAVVEPGRIVAGEARGQDLGLPGSRRGAEAFELPDHLVEGIGAFHARIVGDALPGEQEAQEVARRHRLDLRAQALDGVGVHARQQTALAPFLLVHARREAPAHGEAFGLERYQGGRDLILLQPERRGERTQRDRTQALQPAAHDLDQGLLGAPARARMARRAPRSADRAGRPATAPGTAADARRRSTASPPAGCRRAARFSAVSSASQPLQPAPAWASASVR